MRSARLREQVLWVVRDLGPCGLADVCDVLHKEREISMNAVQTVLNRLVDQEIVAKTGTRRHYLYELKPSAEVVRDRAAKAAVDLLSQSGDLGLAHFVDTMDSIEPESVAKLEALLAARRARKRSDHDGP